MEFIGFIGYSKNKKQDTKTGITINNYAGNTNFIAVTLSESKPFKTEKGADKWLKSKGYEREGIKYSTHIKINERIKTIRSQNKKEANAIGISGISNKNIIAEWRG